MPLLTVSFAWFFQAFTGFGAGIFIVGVLSLFYEPKEVIVSSAVVNLAGTLLILWQNRKARVDMRLLAYLILPSVPSIYLGAYLLSLLDKHTLKLIIGVFILLLGFYDLLVQSGKLRLRLGRRSGPLAGFLGGLFAGLVGLGGPPPAVYLNQNTQDPRSFKLMLNIYFTSNILLRLLFYGVQDTLYINTEIILYSLVGIPLGVLLGSYAGGLLSGRSFKGVVSTSVLLLGALLLIL